MPERADRQNDLSLLAMLSLAVVLMITSAAFLHSIAVIQRVDEQTERNRRILFHSERLVSELSGLEALQRTFLLSGEVDFTAAHAKGIKAIAQEFDQLKIAAAEEADATSGQVESITNIVSRRLEVLDRTAGIRRSGTIDAVLSTLRRSQGTEIMNAAKREILALETDAAARLGDQTVKLKESLRMMRWGALLAGLSGFLLLGNAVCRVYGKRE